MKSIIRFIFFICLFISCKPIKNAENPQLDFKDASQAWYQKDYNDHKLPGISIDKWYNENKKKSKTNIIVAIIDTQVDINHEDLQGQLWTNTKEIANNNIDDDDNGYIDDINGWNFTSNKKGDYVVWGNFSCLRIIRKWDPIFKEKKKIRFHQKNCQILKNIREL